MNKLTFFTDGYYSRAYAYDETTRLYLRKNDEKKIILVEFSELERKLKELFPNSDIFK